MMEEEMKQGEMQEKAVKRTRRRKTETLFGNKYFVNKEYVEATKLAERMMGGTEKIDAFICEIEAEIDIFLSTIINPNMVLRKYKHAYAILQFKKGVDRHIRFAGLGVLQANGLMPHSANYEIVYEKKLEQKEIPEDEHPSAMILWKYSDGVPQVSGNGTFGTYWLQHLGVTEIWIQWNFSLLIP